MSLVYCTSKIDFLKSVNLWINRLQNTSGEHYVFDDVFTYFLSNSSYSDVLIRNSLACFEVDKFTKLLNEWIAQELIKSPNQASSINKNAELILKFINDEVFAINNGLVVFECLSDRQKGLKKRNG